VLLRSVPQQTSFCLQSACEAQRTLVPEQAADWQVALCVLPPKRLVVVVMQHVCPVEQ
jgi:hypothetical protein